GKNSRTWSPSKASTASPLSSNTLQTAWASVLLPEAGSPVNHNTQPVFLCEAFISNIPLSIDHFCDLVVNGTVLDPPHTEQIDNGAEQSVTDTIMGLSGKPSIVLHRYFRHCIPFHFDQGRQVALGTAEEPYLRDALTFEC